MQQTEKKRGGARACAGRPKLEIKKMGSPVYLYPSDKAILIHKYGSLTSALESLVPKKKELTKAEHAQKMKAVFVNMSSLSRDAIVERMKVIYKCGATKITGAAGLLRQAMDAGVVEKVGKEYALKAQ